MNSLVLRSGAKMPSIGFGTFVGGKNSADAYKGIWIDIKKKTDHVENFQHKTKFGYICISNFQPSTHP